MENSSCRKCGT